MSVRILRRAAALASLAACLCAPLPARAADPEPPVEEIAKSVAPKDTSRFLPRWLHAHAAIGLGWIASPLAIRQLYQAGQGYEAGLEARPRSTWRVRLNADYQTLPVVTDAHLVVTIPVFKGESVKDTLHLEARGNGWLGSGRLELQKALIPGFWALGGLGGGYLNSGLDVVNTGIGAISIANEFPGASGWALMPTFGGIAEFDVLGPTLGIEVRWTGIMKPNDHLQAWTVRIGWQGF